jgi:hypothetical protein
MSAVGFLNYDHVSPNYERLAKRVLSLAARSSASQGEQLKSANFEKLLTWAKKGKRQDRGGEIEKRLTESVTYLRDRDFLWQGFGWKCSFCQHNNWVPLEQLSPIAKCEICRKPQSSPVSGSLHFRLNPFVHHAFASTSGQEPVIWCLDQLARRARWSFIIAQMIEEARASQIVERIIFGGSFVSARPAPNDFDCIVVLHRGTRYEMLQPFQRWVADTREASRRYRGDVFVATTDQATLGIYMEFFAVNRHGKQIGLVEVIL